MPRKPKEELRVYTFDPRFEIYGFTRQEAVTVLLNLLGELEAAEPVVAFVHQNLSMDRAWLKRRGIEVDGAPAVLVDRHRPPLMKQPPAWMIKKESQRRARKRRRRGASEPSNLRRRAAGAPAGIV
jgi:hypothetical protein